MENQPKESEPEPKYDKPPPRVIRMDVELQKKLVMELQKKIHLQRKKVVLTLYIITLAFISGLIISYNKWVQFPNGIEVICDCKTYNYTYLFIIFMIIGGIVWTMNLFTVVNIYRDKAIPQEIAKLTTNIEKYENLVNELEKKENDPHANV